MAEAPGDGYKNEGVVHQRREMNNRRRASHDRGLAIVCVRQGAAEDAERDENRGDQEPEPHDEEEGDDYAVPVIDSAEAEEEEETGGYDG